MAKRITGFEDLLPLGKMRADEAFLGTACADIGGGAGLLTLQEADLDGAREASRSLRRSEVNQGRSAKTNGR